MITYGFYNAIDHDRQYNARHFSQIFDGVIEDGVYDNIGERFAVTPNTTVSGALKVNVGTGRAWFNGTWTRNDAMITLSIDPSDLHYYRMDAVIFGIDTRQGKNNRKNVVGIKKGATAHTLDAVQPPTMAHTVVNAYERYDEYPIAYILIPPNATEVLAANITNKVGSSECPYASIIGNRDTRLLRVRAANWVANNGMYIQDIYEDTSGVPLPYTDNAMPILTRYPEWTATAVEQQASCTAFNIIARGAAMTGNGYVRFKVASLPASDVVVALRGQ